MTKFIEDKKISDLECCEKCIHDDRKCSTVSFKIDSAYEISKKETGKDCLEDGGYYTD